MPKKKHAGGGSWVDPDDAPELTEEHFRQADVYVGNTLVRRGSGRPPLPAPKRQVTIRLDATLLEEMRATGPGWQTRINEAVREWLARHAAR
jgi:uncharacterized protein (DUF4415 family)